MFNYVVISLPSEFATAIHDLILKPPGENPYNTIKEQLIQQPAASEQLDYNSCLVLKSLVTVSQLSYWETTAISWWYTGTHRQHIFLQAIPSEASC